MKKLLSLVILLSSLVTLLVHPFNQAQLQSAEVKAKASTAEASEAIAKQAHESILKKVGSNDQYRVAVFAFGDANNKVTIPLGSESLNLQGEIMFHLRKLGSGKYFVLDMAGLAREFKDKGLDPAGINPGNPKETAKVLKEIGIDVAVVGAMQGSSRADFVEREDKQVPIAATLVFQDGTTDTSVAGKFDATTLPLDGPSPNKKENKLSGRFTVEMTIDGAVQTYVQGDYPKGDAKFHNVYFIVLDETAKGKEYKLKIGNKGLPKAGIANPHDEEKEKDRLYAAAVKVDGVNSIYQDQGDKKVGPIVLHPKNCQKWILTGPGKVLLGMPNNGFAIKKTDEGKPDHSSREILGFQKGPDKAAAFTLGSARESIAETVGITNSIGLIEVHFYPQKLPGDEVLIDFAEQEAGTIAGRELKHDVQQVKLELHDNPVEVWRIFYRYKGDPSVKKVTPITLNTKD